MTKLAWRTRATRPFEKPAQEEKGNKASEVRTAPKIGPAYTGCVEREVRLDVIVNCPLLLFYLQGSR